MPSTDVVAIHASPARHDLESRFPNWRREFIDENFAFSPGQVALERLRHTPSGFTMLLCTAPRAAITSVNIVVPTLPPDNSGQPHCLEHLCFLGSKRHPRGVLDRAALSCISSGTNAWTAEDHTAYTFDTAASDGAMRLLPVFLDHVFRPLLTKSAFLTEVHHIDGEGRHQGVVYNEMLGRESTEGDLRDLAARVCLFRGSPEALDSGGLTKDIRRLQHAHVVAFHRQNYRPERAVCVVVGPMTTEQQSEILHAVDAYFHSLTTPFIASKDNEFDACVVPAARLHSSATLVKELATATVRPRAKETHLTPLIRSMKSALTLDGKSVVVAPDSAFPVREDLTANVSGSALCPLLRLRHDIAFPAEESDGVGSVSIYFATSHLNDDARELLSVLFRCLSTNGSSPLQQALTQTNPPLCSDVGVSTFEFSRGRTAIGIVCSGVGGLSAPSSHHRDEADRGSEGAAGSSETEEDDNDGTHLPTVDVGTTAGEKQSDESHPTVTPDRRLEVVPVEDVDAAAVCDDADAVVLKAWRTLTACCEALEGPPSAACEPDSTCTDRLRDPDVVWHALERELDMLTEHFEDDPVDYLTGELIHCDLWRHRWFEEESSVDSDGHSTASPVVLAMRWKHRALTSLHAEKRRCDERGDGVAAAQLKQAFRSRLARVLRDLISVATDEFNRFTAEGNTLPRLNSDAPPMKACAVVMRPSTELAAANERLQRAAETANRRALKQRGLSQNGKILAEAIARNTPRVVQDAEWHRMSAARFSECDVSTTREVSPNVFATSSAACSSSLVRISFGFGGVDGVNVESSGTDTAALDAGSQLPWAFVPTLILASMPFECDLRSLKLPANSADAPRRNDSPSSHSGASDDAVAAAMSYEQVGRECEKHLLSYSVGPGLDGNLIDLGLRPDVVDVSAIATEAELPHAISLLVHATIGCVVTPGRLSIVLQKLATDLAMTVREGEGIAQALVAFLSYERHSPWSQQHPLGLLRGIERLVATFSRSDSSTGSARDGAAQSLCAWVQRHYDAAVRRLAFVHVCAGSPEVAERAAIMLHSTWTTAIAASRVDSRMPRPMSASPRWTVRCHNATPAAKSGHFIVEDSATDSCTVAIRYGPLRTRGRTTRAAALSILCEWLSVVEGPLYNAVRGEGAAYGVALSYDAMDGWLDLSIDDATDAFKSIVACLQCLETKLHDFFAALPASPDDEAGMIDERSTSVLQTYHNEISQARASLTFSNIETACCPGRLRSAFFRELLWRSSDSIGAATHASDTSSTLVLTNRFARERVACLEAVQASDVRHAIEEMLTVLSSAPHTGIVIVGSSEQGAPFLEDGNEVGGDVVDLWSIVTGCSSTKARNTRRANAAANRGKRQNSRPTERRSQWTNVTIKDALTMAAALQHRPA